MSQQNEEGMQTLRKSADGSWPLTLDAIPDAVELGRLLHETILKWAEDKGKTTLHVRLLHYAFGYVNDLHDEKTHILTDDFLRTNQLIKQENLQNRVNEPYVQYLAQEAKRVEEEKAAQSEAAVVA